MQKFNNARGFTILEALIAFLIFTLGALAITEFMVRSVAITADGKLHTEGLHLAKAAMAEFRNFTSRDEVVAYTTNTTGDSITGNAATFTRTWTVANVTGNSNAILVEVNVAWTGSNGTKNVSLTSQIAKLKPESAGKYLMN